MKIILASQSPRRAFLMQQMGLEFEQIPSDFDEYFDDTRPAEEIAKELGLGKANAVAEKYPDAIVIGSDLVIESDGIQIGKADSKDEAVEMLTSFSEKPQSLIASVAVVCKSKQVQMCGVDIATVIFPEITEEFATEYVSKRDIFDRAGAYDIRHPEMQQIGLKTEGRFDTIIGLPTNLVASFLKEFGIDVEPVEVQKDMVFESGFDK